MPVFLIFSATYEVGGGVVFEGIGVPKLDMEDGGLKVIAQYSGLERIENYLAHFNLLEDRVISRAWIDLLLADPAKAKLDPIRPTELGKWIEGLSPRLLSPI